LVISHAEAGPLSEEAEQQLDCHYFEIPFPPQIVDAYDFLTSAHGQSTELLPTLILLSASFSIPAS
jgi:hypothetical protein